MKVAFVGLGKMGSAMAHNLLKAGHELAVYNRSAEKAAPFAAAGARIATSPAGACSDADLAFTMLADDHAVEEVVFGDQGIATALKPGSIHVSSSTISTSLARRLAEEHGQRLQHFISAPVFGRPEAAEKKQLVVVAAGAADVVDDCRPLFHAIGRVTFVAGSEPWQANAVKLCGNFMIACMLETFGEAYATLRKAGVDPHLFLDTINAVFNSPVYANYGKIVADQKFEPAGFALKLGLKDVRLVLQTAEECASPMPLASVVRDRLLAAVARGQGDMDWSSVAKIAEINAGL